MAVRLMRAFQRRSRSMYVDISRSWVGDRTADSSSLRSAEAQEFWVADRNGRSSSAMRAECMRNLIVDKKQGPGVRGQRPVTSITLDLLFGDGRPESPELGT